MEGLQGDLSWSSAAVIARKWLLANSLFSFFLRRRRRRRKQGGIYWTEGLHRNFLEAVRRTAWRRPTSDNNLSLFGKIYSVLIRVPCCCSGDPKVDIKEQMDVEDLTNDQLRSHLQVSSGPR